MVRDIKGIRVFIASPSGLADERKAFREVILDYNEAEAIPRGVLFQPIGWEDTLGAVGRPQSIINEDVRASDYFILLLWDRWGSLPDTTCSPYTSGTEEEYHIAMECYNSKEFSMRQVVMMFKSVDARQLSDPGQQLQKVLEFRKTVETEKSHLFHSFDTIDSFEKLLRKHLAAWLRNEEHDGTVRKEQPPSAGPLIEEASVNIPKQQLGNFPAEKLVDKAWKLADEGRLTEAEIEFARAIVGQSQIHPILEFGRFLARIGRLDQAIVMFEGAARVAEDQKDLIGISAAYANKGIILQTRGNLDGAEQMLRKALEIYEKMGLMEGIASVYSNLGNVLFTRGNLDSAEYMYQKVLEIEEKLGHVEAMACAYGNLGNVSLVHGNLDNAEQMIKKALEIDEKLNRLEDMAIDYGILGNILNNRGDLDGAEQMYRKALEIDERLNHLKGMATTYGNLGVVLGKRNNWDGAERMFRKALEFNEKIGHLEGMANAYGNLGNVCRNRGDLDSAEQMHRKSLEIEEKMGHLEGMANDYVNLGNVFKNRGDLGVAEQMYRKSLAISEKLGSSILISMAKADIENLYKSPSDTADDA